MSEARIFIDLIMDEMRTDFIRLKSHSTIRENLEKNILGKFYAYGNPIDQVSRKPNQISNKINIYF